MTHPLKMVLDWGRGLFVSLYADQQHISNDISEKDAGRASSHGRLGMDIKKNPEHRTTI